MTIVIYGVLQKLILSTILLLFVQVAFNARRFILKPIIQLFKFIAQYIKFICIITAEVMFTPFYNHRRTLPTYIV